MKQIALLLGMAVTVPVAGNYPHGTAVVTLAIRDGFVMAADGRTTLQQGIEAKPLIGDQVVIEPKIAICGIYLLCGMAGINPVHNNYEGRLKVEYDFQEWISRIPADTRTSPRQFANAIHNQARSTFRDMDSIMKIDPFWKSEAAPQWFIIFQIVGYEGDVPQMCQIRIRADLQNYRLEYPAPERSTPEWKNPSPTSARFALLSGSGLNEILTEGTPRQMRFTEIKPKAIATAVSLLPDIPPSLQTTAGAVAAIVRVMEEFNPEIFGGPITIGIIQKGKLPRVQQFPGF